MSNEKRPVGSVGDASMSPRSSHTTNVLPSRIRTIWLAIVSPSACRPSATTRSSAGRSGSGTAAGSGRARSGRRSCTSSSRSVDAIAFARPRDEVVHQGAGRGDDAVTSASASDRVHGDGARRISSRQCSSGRRGRRPRAACGSCAGGPGCGRARRGLRRTRTSGRASRTPVSVAPKEGGRGSGTLARGRGIDDPGREAADQPVEGRSLADPLVGRSLSMSAIVADRCSGV